MAKYCQTILINHYRKAINFQIDIFSVFIHLEGRMFEGGRRGWWWEMTMIEGEFGGNHFYIFLNSIFK